MDRSFSSHPHQADHAPPDVVLYHADCSDGFGAAWALWKKYPKTDYQPVKHGFPPPPQLGGAAHRYGDYSILFAPALETMAQQAASLQVLDHHITAQDALAGLPFAYFDLKKSGAVLAWEWAHQQPAPWLLQYVQDKDFVELGAALQPRN